VPDVLPNLFLAKNYFYFNY